MNMRGVTGSLLTIFIPIPIGEGNNNPFQYSCLGNPRDRGAWQLQSVRLQSVGHDWVTNTHIPSFTQTHPPFHKLELCAWVLTQSCPIPWDPTDCSRPDSSIHRIFQARILEWAAIFCSRTLELRDCHFMLEKVQFCCRVVFFLSFFFFFFKYHGYMGTVSHLWYNERLI